MEYGIDGSTITGKPYCRIRAGTNAQVLRFSYMNGGPSSLNGWFHPVGASVYGICIGGMYGAFTFAKLARIM